MPFAAWEIAGHGSTSSPTARDDAKGWCEFFVVRESKSSPQRAGALMLHWVGRAGPADMAEGRSPSALGR